MEGCLRGLTDRKRGRGCELSSTLTLTSCPDVFLYIFCSHPFSATKQVFPSLHTILFHLVWLEEKWINFFCLFLQILYNKNPQHLLKNKWGKKIRRIFVCISSCTLALNGRVSQDWQMYILVAVLSCSVTLKEHTHARTLPPLDFIFHFCFVSGGFNVFLCHSSSECKHTQAWSFSLD